MSSSDSNSGEGNVAGGDNGRSGGAVTLAVDPDDICAPIDFTVRARLPFPVVGIGASAGGLEALRAFFGAAMADSGMAYVVIQHLSPEHQSLMAEILGHCTTMPVCQITDGMSVRPDHVYVIRPGYTVTLADGKLHLAEPVEQRGHRRPVDDFFRSLAREQKECAVGVILSGTGTNGSAGAQAIKAVGGLCIAQDPQTAEFPGMPQSLVHAGYADQVLAAEAIPALLLRYMRHPPRQLDPTGSRQETQALERHREQLQEILTEVRIRTGHDFGSYKEPTVLRRIARRMGLLGMAALADYATYLRDRPAEAAALANDLMINVTGFFRDPQAWEALRETVVRPLVEQRAAGEPVRAWVAACASGEEPYSLAMLIAEEAERAGKQLEVKIFATDTADKSLALARAGVYPAGIEGDLSVERLDQFFEKQEHTYKIRPSLREQVVFASHDLLRDPPFSRADIVTCRNILIYLEPEAQRRALTLLRFALRDGGSLLLGNAETLGYADNLFEVVSKRWRIYRRNPNIQSRLTEVPTPLVRSPDLHPVARVTPMPAMRAGPISMIQTALLEQFVPPAVVVDANERVVFFHGDTAPFLQNPPGEVTHNLLEMVRVGLRAAVRGALRLAISERRSNTVEAGGAGTDSVAITAVPLQHGTLPDQYCVSFSVAAACDPAQAAKHGGAIELSGQRISPIQGDPALEEEVRYLRRELQYNVEAFETANEELKASNEEVTSINEELQSTNEELETGKEELQSLNEELATVNAQLQAKVLELEATTGDLDNLLSSTDIAVVFLDPQLRVRRFTPAITDLLELIPADIGRPLAHLAQKFSDGDMIADARSVLARLVPLESEARSHSGRWYLRRTLPYRTEDNRIAGVVVTFIDISARKLAERSIAAAQGRLQAVIEQMPAAMLMVEAPSGKLMVANRSAATLFNQPFPLPYVGHDWTAAYSAFHGLHEDERPYQPGEWPLARALATGEIVFDEELSFIRPDHSRGIVSMSAAPISNQEGEVVAAVATFWDISQRKHAEAALRESEERFRMLIDSAHDYAIFMLDLNGNVISWNPGAERVTGYREADILGQPGALLFTPEDRAAGVPQQQLRLAEQTGRAIDERWHLRRDGTRLWASGVTTVARDTKGSLQGFVKIMRDQTDRKSLDSQLQTALQSAQKLRVSAEEANRAKDEFISTVSHELRTPLNTIRLWSTMLATGKVQAEEVIEGSRMIDRAALAQQQLIDDLLDVSRMASGGLRLALRETRLTEVIEAAIAAIQPLAHSRQIALICALDADVGTVRVDPDRIQQVVWNLLANAVKFTQEGGRVEVTLRRSTATLEIEVKDTGVGIDPLLLPHVFDRFWQADASPTRRYAGLGLGLAIVKQLVELHGGTITVASEGIGRGTSFAVHLPLDRYYTAPAAPAAAAAATSRDVADGRGRGTDAGALQGIEVLLVEDEALTSAATTRLLERFGAQVRTADSAARAREAYERHRPDVIVADIGMSDEDGYTLLAGLRRSEQRLRHRTPAIAVTAFARREDRERALAAGFDDHLSKPVDAEQLIALLARLARKTP